MVDIVQEEIKRIEENGWVEILRQCRSVKDRIDKLIGLVPETWPWGPTYTRQLVFCLQRTYDIDFGVCDFYIIEGGRQYCIAGGDEVECSCDIPKAYCVFRDKDGVPKYPEFLLITSLKEMGDCEDALCALSDF